MNQRGCIYLISLLLLAGACSDNPTEPEPDPEPDPVNSPMSITLDIPSSYHFDEPVAHSFRAVDQDTIRDGFVRYLEDGEEVFYESLKDHNDVRVRIDWTPSPDGPGIGRVEYEVIDGFVDGPEVKSGSESIDILDTRLTEASVSVYDIFSGQGISEGSVTINNPRSSSVRSVSIRDGEAFFGLDQEIDADSLANGQYMVLVESPGYVERGVSLSQDGTGGLESLTLIPEGANSSDGSVWSYNTYLDHLYEDRNTGDLRSNRWSDFDEDGNQLVVDVLLYDQSYLVPCEDTTGPCRVASSDPNLIASDTYLENSEEAYRRLDEVIPNIKLNFIRESESEEPFPKKLGTTGYVIDIAGSQHVNFAISRTHFTGSDGTLLRARAIQRTDPPATNVSVAAALADGIENMSLSTTGQESLTVNLNAREITPFGLDALHVLYSRAPHSGSYSVELDRSDGTTTSTVRDYTPPSQ